MQRVQETWYRTMARAERWISCRKDLPERSMTRRQLLGRRWSGWEGTAQRWTRDHLEESRSWTGISRRGCLSWFRSAAWHRAIDHTMSTKFNWTNSGSSGQVLALHFHCVAFPPNSASRAVRPDRSRCLFSILLSFRHLSRCSLLDVLFRFDML
jgi:hypothetical protein